MTPPPESETWTNEFTHKDDLSRVRERIFNPLWLHTPPLLPKYPVRKPNITFPSALPSEQPNSVVRKRGLTDRHKVSLLRNNDTFSTVYHYLGTVFCWVSGSPQDGEEGGTVSQSQAHTSTSSTTTCCSLDSGSPYCTTSCAQLDKEVSRKQLL